jgi:hypothetical protein
MMTLECVVYVDVNIDYLVERCLKEKAFDGNKITAIINDYVSGFDDIEYYALTGSEAYDNLIYEVIERVKKKREGK